VHIGLPSDGSVIIKIIVQNVEGQGTHIFITRNGHDTICDTVHFLLKPLTMSIFCHYGFIVRVAQCGIATGYGLDGPGIESRRGARFSAPVQTGPGAHPAFFTVGTGSFPGVKSGRGVTLTPQPF